MYYCYYVVLTGCWQGPDPASSLSTQRMTISIDVQTEMILLMMSSKPVRNMQRLTIEISSSYTDVSRCTVNKTLKLITMLNKFRH